jgi:hypothetical protein
MLLTPISVHDSSIKAHFAKHSSLIISRDHSISEHHAYSIKQEFDQLDSNIMSCHGLHFGTVIAIGVTSTGIYTPTLDTLL